MIANNIHQFDQLRLSEVLRTKRISLNPRRKIEVLIIAYLRYTFIHAIRSVQLQRTRRRITVLSAPVRRVNVGVWQLPPATGFCEAVEGVDERVREREDRGECGGEGVERELEDAESRRWVGSRAFGGAFVSKQRLNIY